MVGTPWFATRSTTDWEVNASTDGRSGASLAFSGQKLEGFQLSWNDHLPTSSSKAVCFMKNTRGLGLNGLQPIKRLNKWSSENMSFVSQ